LRSRNSSVSIVITLRTGPSEVGIPAGANDFSPNRPDLPGGLAIFLTNGHRVSLLEVKYPGLDVNHSRSSAKVMNEWSHTSTPTGVDRENFMFTVLDD
jgi:hypothetical protein